MKPFLAYRTLMAGNWMLDHLTLVVVVLCVILFTIHGKLQIAKSMHLVLVMLVITYVIMPISIGGYWFVDARLPVAIFFVAISSMQPLLRSKPLGKGLLLGLGLLLVLKSGMLSYDWYSYDKIIRAFTDSFARLPPRSILFVATEAPGPNITRLDQLWQPPLKHVASLAAVNQSIFVPATWADPAQQPITVTSTYKAIYDLQTDNARRVRNESELANFVDLIRRQAFAPAVPPAPVFLLVIYPQILQLRIPNGTTVVGSDPRFLLLAVNNNRAGRRGRAWTSSPKGGPEQR